MKYREVKFDNSINDESNIQSTKKGTNNEFTTNKTGPKKHVSSIGFLTRSKRRKLDKIGSTTTTVVESQQNESSTSVECKKRKANSVLCDTRSKRRKLDGKPESKTMTTTPEPIEKVAVALSTVDLVSDGESSKNLTVFNAESKPQTTIAEFQFSIGDVVWGKIRGWAHWPAQIIAIENRHYVVKWFNDYRTTKLFRSQIFTFYANFPLFAEKFDSVVGLKDAAHEAMVYLKPKEIIL